MLMHAYVMSDEYDTLHTVENVADHRGDKSYTENRNSRSGVDQTMSHEDS